MQNIHTTKTSLHCNALLALSPTELLVGQYQLSESKEHRDGRLSLYQVTAAASALTPIANLDFPKCGIFDLTLLNKRSSNLIIAACTDGNAKLVAVSDDKTELSVVQVIPTGKEMMTSCCYLSVPVQAIATTAAARFVSAHHQGTICVRVKDCKKTFPAHDYDAWCVAPALVDEAGNPSETIFFSGGDDAKLKIWDIAGFVAEPEDDEDDVQEAAVVKEKANEEDDDDEDQGGAVSKSTTSSDKMKLIGCAVFGAGVVCIVPLSPTLVLVGTYDERVYLIDVQKVLRSAPRPVNVESSPAAISSVRVGGGAWRLRELQSSSPTFLNVLSVFDEQDTEVLLKDKPHHHRVFMVAAMHGGATAVALDIESGKLSNLRWKGGVEALHFPATNAATVTDEDKEKKPSEPTPDDEPLIYDVAQLDAGLLASLQQQNRIKDIKMPLHYGVVAIRGVILATDQPLSPAQHAVMMKFVDNLPEYGYRASYQKDNVTYHCLVDNTIMYIVAANSSGSDSTNDDNTTLRTAFACLNAICAAFKEQLLGPRELHSEPSNLTAASCFSFGSVIAEKIRHFNENPQDKNSKLKNDEAERVKKIMIENIDRIINRDMEPIISYYSIEEEASMFHNNALKLRRAMLCRQIKIIAAIWVVVLLIGFIVSLIVCKPNYSRCKST